MQKRKAFTLIELLVVISIIAVLMSIMMPALGRVRKQAKMLICQTNLKQYGVGGNMYMTDNDGRFPLAWDGLYKNGVKPNNCQYPKNLWCEWHNPDFNLQSHPELGGPLWQYLSNTKVHVCPIFAKLAKLHVAAGKGCSGRHKSEIPIEPNFSYTQNGNLGFVEGTGHVDTPFKAKKISQVKRLSSVFFFGEESAWQVDYEDENLYDGGPLWSLNDNSLMATWEQNRNVSISSPDQVIGPDGFASFHKAKKVKYEYESFDDPDLGVSNAVFIDGSVKEVHVRDTYKLSATR